MIKRLLKIASVLFFIASFNTYATENECTPYAQYQFVWTSPEGEEMLMFATCLWDKESSSYQWYRSNFNPFEPGNG